MPSKSTPRRPSIVQTLRSKLGIRDKKTVGLTDFSRKNFKKAAKETWLAIFDRKLLTLAAGSAYYVILALIPTIAAFLAITSMVVSKDDLIAILNISNQFLPEELARFVDTQLPSIVKTQPQNMFVLILMIGFALFMASNAMDNMMNAVNAAFNLKERRGPLRFKITSLLLGMGVILLLFLNTTLLLVSTQAIRFQTEATWMQTAGMNILRFIMIFALTSLIVVLLYRFGPDHKNPHTGWVTWGAIMASVFWFVATMVFFVYIQYFVDFTQVFGVLAGMFVVMAWIELSCIILVVGAAVNGQLTKQAEQLFEEQC